MNARIICGCAALTAVLSVAALACAATPVGTTITYQGQLKQSGTPVDGTVDFEFRLFDVPAGGAPINGLVLSQTMTATDGLFTAELDFGAGGFTGDERWLDIAVRFPAGSGNYTPLVPRQRLNASPYSLFALNAMISGTQGGAVNFTNAGNTYAGNGTGLTSLNASNLTSGTLGGSLLSGAYGNALTLSNASNSFTGNGAGLTGVNADLLDGLNSTAFLQSIPVPLTLSGASDTHILRVQNTSSTHESMAIFGESTGTGASYGVRGQSLNGLGVYGSSVTGKGVFGEATADDSYPGTTYGVFGQAYNQFGIGVVGFGATGVWGETNRPTGVAVYGRATDFTGTNYGVFGTSLSPNGYAGYFAGRGYFSGNVGIGTEFPSHRLTVQSPTISAMRLIGPTGPFQYGARFNFGDADYAYIEEDTDDNLSFRADRFAFVNGNIGIGLTAPTFQLQLSTNSAAKPTSSSWTISSDERLKKNIHAIDGALNQLLQLHGVTYQWKDPASQGDMAGTYTGMIAQDVEKVFPEWISTGPDGYKTLTVIGFEGLTVEALRELRAEKDEQVEHLNSENADLRARVESLETAMRQLLANQSGGPR